ncbi:hypothetical protein PPTG_04480 [Phytophthora nicotianae INRA-310]|uniref:Uncharacterized protein n=1 Tax=Phytophthora nicotianae (strain INRA-310) TaxID=761204 RepID=W2R3I3_PHYN3|nr:hypothetical protein PPTG_04480 [Phytophthora nicotianae INRA-310]ETN19065.1 hypothetical protein PPTG_04480 [Phytophthora nicotianae INRA-310]
MSFHFQSVEVWRETRIKNGIVSTALMLCLDEVVINHDKEVAEAQHKDFQLLIDEVWKVAMRSQHYLTELFKHYKFDEARGYLSVDEVRRMY